MTRLLSISKFYDILAVSMLLCCSEPWMYRSSANWTSVTISWAYNVTKALEHKGAITYILHASILYQKYWYGDDIITSSQEYSTDILEVETDK